MPESASTPQSPSETDAYVRWRRRERLQEVMTYVIAGVLLSALAVAVYFMVNSNVFTDFQSNAQKAMDWGYDHTKR